MTLWIKTMLLHRIIRNALIVSAIVGTFLNIINQGPMIIAGEEISGVNLLLTIWYLTVYPVIAPQRTSLIEKSLETQFS